MNMLNSLGWEPLQDRLYIAQLGMLLKNNNNIHVVVPESQLQQGDYTSAGLCISKPPPDLQKFLSPMNLLELK